MRQLIPPSVAARATRSMPSMKAAVRSETLRSLDEVPDFFERGGERFVELLPHAVEVPAIELAVLRPLEVAHRHAAGVGQDIGQHDHAGGVEDVVGVRLRPARWPLR